MSTYNAKHRPAFAGLFILIAVAIMMVLMMIQMNTLFQPGRGYQKSTAPASRPWLEEELIIPQDKIIEMPKPPKPTIEEDFTITTPVTRNETDRGELALEFRTSGEVFGSWQCRYSHENQDYTYNAEFAGNIDITSTYSDKKEVQDPSKLYFITKGKYIQTIYNTKTEEYSSKEGQVFTTGWLNPDFSASGKITITTDRSWSADYLWQSPPP